MDKKNDSRPLNQHFLMTYSLFIFICVILYAKRLSGVVRQRILVTYSPLIFVCVNCVSFSPQPTIFLAEYSFSGIFFQRIFSTFYSGMFTAYHCMRRHRRQTAQSTYSLLIFCMRKLRQSSTNDSFNSAPITYFFVCVGCLDTSTNVLQRNIRSLSLYDFCLRRTVPETPPTHLLVHNFLILLFYQYYLVLRLFLSY